MIVVLVNAYIALLVLFVWLKFIPFNTFWKLSPVIVLCALLVGLFIPMGWGAPSGPVATLRNSVQIIPSVSGEVADVPVTANTPLKAGDVLFRIDPTTYEAQLRGIEAQLKLAEMRFGQYSQLQKADVGRAFDVQQHEAERDRLRAERDAAQWNLDRTTVRAPADGYVTNLALRKGARVTGQTPVMAFIDTGSTLLGAEIAQNHARYIEPGQPVEVTFKMFPGRIFTGKVETVIQAIATGQSQPGGVAIAPEDLTAAPFVVRFALDDPAIGQGLPAGATGTVAIFTDHIKAAHAVRRVVLRQTAILNYVNPF